MERPKGGIPKDVVKKLDEEWDRSGRDGQKSLSARPGLVDDHVEAEIFADTPNSARLDRILYDSNGDEIIREDLV